MTRVPGSAVRGARTWAPQLGLAALDGLRADVRRHTRAAPDDDSALLLCEFGRARSTAPGVRESQ